MTTRTAVRCAAICWIIFAGGFIATFVLRMSTTSEPTNPAFWFVALVGVVLWVAGPVIAARLLLRGGGLEVSLAFAGIFAFFLVLGVAQIFARDAWRRPEPAFGILSAVLAGSYLGAALFTVIAWKRRKAHEAVPPPLPVKYQ